MAKADTFKDSFATVGVSGCWRIDDGASGSPIGGGSTVVFGGPGATVHCAAGGDNVRLSTADVFDLSSSSVAVHISLSSAPVFRGFNFSIYTYAAADGSGTVAYDANFIVSMNRLDLTEGGGSPTVLDPFPYPGYLRFRHVGTTLYWETSSDGVTWTVRRTSTLYSNLVYTRILVMFYTDATGPTDGVFNNINGGGMPVCPAAPNWKSELLGDSFAYQSGCWTVHDADGGGGIHTVPPTPPNSVTFNNPGARLHADIAGGAPWPGVGMTTVDLFDLGDSTASIHWASLPSRPMSDPGAMIAQFFADIPGVGARTNIYWESSDTFAFGNTGGAPPSVVVTLSPPPLHWRFRYVNSTRTLYWETSTDGTTWTVRNSRTFAAGAITITSVRFAFSTQVLDTSEATALRYNAGGVPICPAVPVAPSGFVFASAY